MKSIGGKSKSPKSIQSKQIVAGKIMAKASNLANSGKLNNLKKLYGNDRGAFLHKQATTPKSNNHASIGSPR